MSDDEHIRESAQGAPYPTAPNTLIIDQVYIFASVDPTNGFEGVIAFESSFGPMPMIAADEKRLITLLPIARIIASAKRITIKVLRMSTREDCGEIAWVDGELRVTLSDRIKPYDEGGL